MLTFNHRAPSNATASSRSTSATSTAASDATPTTSATVNLADPPSSSARCRSASTARLLADFERYINTVTVTLRKQHQNGQRRCARSCSTASAQAERRSLRDGRYGWNGDDDHAAWLEYDYRTRWSFKGGGTLPDRLDARRRADDRPLRALPAADRPARRRRARRCKQRGVRAVVVEVEYPFFGEPRRQRWSCGPTGARPEPAPSRSRCRSNQFEYGYVDHLAARGRSPADREGPGLERHRLHGRTAGVVGAGGRTMTTKTGTRSRCWMLRRPACARVAPPAPWCWTTRTG